MKSKTFFLSFLILLFTNSCVQEHTVKKNTYSDFSEKLKPDMTFEAIVQKFGEPLKDIGSGLHIYVYPLADSTEIWIGFSDRIMYAIQVDKDQNTKKKLY